VYDPRQDGSLSHAGTFNNNALTMSAGLAAIDEFTPDAARELTARGDRLRAELNQLCEKVGASMVFFDMLGAGVYLAGRGMIALSLPIGTDECRLLVDSVAAS